MLWLTYDTKLHFAHVLKDEPWVVDKKCLDVHEHTSDLKFRVQALSDEKLDFKKIKKVIEGLLDQYRDKNISQVLRVNSTEEFVCRLVGDVEVALFSMGHKRKVQLHIQETAKYGVTLE